MLGPRPDPGNTISSPAGLGTPAQTWSQASAAVRQLAVRPGVRVAIYEADTAQTGSDEDSMACSNGPARRTYWVDGSVPLAGTRCGFAIVWPEGTSNPRWCALACHADRSPGPRPEIDQVELAAIARALQHAVDEWDGLADGVRQDSWLVRVWSDSKHSLEAIKSAQQARRAPADVEPTMAAVLKAIERLGDRGAKVQVFWTLSKRSLGNVLADRFAKAASHGGEGAVRRTGVREAWRFKSATTDTTSTLLN
ncbi:MAG: hypothetical protein Q9159_007293 [Coniocarpon cinnabarinum]